MSTGVVVAVYAACVATAALTWQVAMWRRGRATDVRVLLTGGVFGGRSPSAVLVLRNHSGHEVEIRNVGIRPASVPPSRAHREPPDDLMSFDLEGGCPRLLRPYGGAQLVVQFSRSEWVLWARKCDQLMLFGPGAPKPVEPPGLDDWHDAVPRSMSVGVQTDGREWFWSEPFRLRWEPTA